MPSVISRSASVTMTVWRITTYGWRNGRNQVLLGKPGPPRSYQPVFSSVTRKRLSIIFSLGIPLTRSRRTSTMSISRFVMRISANARGSAKYPSMKRYAHSSTVMMTKCQTTTCGGIVLSGSSEVLTLTSIECFAWESCSCLLDL
jgi:hypothetical protein